MVSSRTAARPLTPPFGQLEWTGESVSDQQPSTARSAYQPARTLPRPRPPRNKIPAGSPPPLPDRLPDAHGRGRTADPAPRRPPARKRAGGGASRWGGRAGRGPSPPVARRAALAGSVGCRLGTTTKE